MTDKFLKQLKQLQAIEPGQEYSQKSLRLVLATPQNEFAPNSWRTLLVRVSAVGAMVALALIVVSKSSIPMKVAGLDAYDLRAEAQSLEVNLTLAEIKENSAQSKQTNLALQESAKSDPGHLNTTILKREADGLNTPKSQNDSIDKALEQIAN